MKYAIGSVEFIKKILIVNFVSLFCIPSNIHVDDNQKRNDHEGDKVHSANGSIPTIAFTFYWVRIIDVWITVRRLVQHNWFEKSVPIFGRGS